MTTGTAQDHFFARKDSSAEACDKLARTDDPNTRAELLDQLAADEEHRARWRNDAFGTGDGDDDPYTAAQMIECAHVYRALAATERARATSGQIAVPAGSRAVELVEHADSILRAWALGGGRARLREQLWRRWDGFTVDMAVEAVACLPVPGDRVHLI